jgi:hypothetical protein
MVCADPQAPFVFVFTLSLANPRCHCVMCFMSIVMGLWTAHSKEVALMGPPCVLRAAQQLGLLTMAADAAQGQFTLFMVLVGTQKCQQHQDDANLTITVRMTAGEYIAVEKVEAVYKKNSNLEQIWVYGNSYEAVLVAVVVPNEVRPAVAAAGALWPAALCSCLTAAASNHHQKWFVVCINSP